MVHVAWQDAPEDHDFPAATDYLSLLGSATAVEAWVAGLRAAPTVRRKAKDILRAARLSLFPVDNPHVASDLAKVRHGKALSPVLLVRGNLADGTALQIADGYHRVCASYHLDENTDIPCRLIDASGIPAAGREGQPRSETSTTP